MKYKITYTKDGEHHAEKTPSDITPDQLIDRLHDLRQHGAMYVGFEKIGFVPPPRKKK